MAKISLEDVIEIALEHYQLKQYKQVVEILQPLIQRGINGGGIYLLVGNTYYCLGQYQLAVQVYSEGVGRYTGSADLHANLGHSYIRQGSYDIAIDAYNNVLDIDPDRIEIRRNLIYAYAAIRQTQSAIRECDEILLAIGSQPNNLDIVLESQYNRQNPSPFYLSLIDMYSELHVNGDLRNEVDAQKMYSGKSIVPWISTIKELIASTDSHTLLDYGSGKGLQYQNLLLEEKNRLRHKGLHDYWKVSEIYCYDPAYPPYQKFPQKQYDAVISTDVLEHCYQEDVKWIVDEIFSLAGRFVFINIACYQANKSLPNGDNVHCIIRPAGWWDELLQSVVPNYPRVKYCVLLEYIWVDIEGGKRMFDVCSNFAPADITLDPSAITILEADENFLPYVPYKISVGASL